MRQPALRLAVALGVAALSLLPFVVLDDPAALRLAPMLIVGLVVVAALAGSWPAAVAGVVVTLGYWWDGIPPTGSLALPDSSSRLALAGMAVAAAALPALAGRIEQTVEAVRELDAYRVDAGRAERAARRQMESIARQQEIALALAAGVARAADTVEVAECALDHLLVPEAPAEASIAIVRGDRLEVLASRGSTPEVVAALERVELSRSAWLREVVAGQARYVDDRAAFTADQPDAQVLRLYPSGSWAVIPFRHQTTTGLLSVHHTDPQPLSAYAAHYALLADVIATGLERTRAREELIEQLHTVEAAFAERDRIARILSTTLVPSRLASIPGFSAAGWLEPSIDGVAGDFYDLFAVGHGDWVAVLGDVAGKGAEAAAVTSLARYAARAVSLTDPFPPTIADVANRALQEDSSEVFCTIGIVHCTAACETIDITLAGHPQGRLVHRDGVERIGAHDLALGLEDHQYERRQHRILPGDAVVLYSDGLTDRCEAFGDDELDALLAACWPCRAADVVAAVRQRVATLPVEHLDDVAVLVVARDAEPAPP